MIATRQLGKLFAVGCLSLGGGGIGQVWGETTPDEAERTLNAAIDAGINLLDLAPLYKDAEAFVGRVLAGRYPDNLRISTKHMLGDVPIDRVQQRFEASLNETCRALRRDNVDLLVLHGYIIPNGWHGGPRADLLKHIGTPWDTYVNGVIPAMQSLVAAGRIKGWGITSGPMAKEALNHKIKPDFVHAVTNLLDSSGGMNITGGSESPGQIVEVASSMNVGVMGVRAVAAGALTSALDRNIDENSPEAIDFKRAEGFRAFAAEWGTSPAVLAHRYALSKPGVDTVIIGVKNQMELHDCIAAQAAVPLTQVEMKHIEDSVGRAI